MRGPFDTRIPGLGHLLVGQPDIAGRLSRALALKGELPQFTEQDYNLGITVEDLTRPEFNWLRREARYFGGTQVGAVAAQFSQITFSTLVAGTRGLAVVEKIVLSNITGAANGFIVGMSLTGGSVIAPTLNAAPGDDRVGIAPGGFGPGMFGVGFGTSAGTPIAAPTFTTIQLPANESFVLEGPWVLTGAPIGIARSILVVTSTQVNVAIAASFYWRERSLLATELQ